MEKELLSQLILLQCFEQNNTGVSVTNLAQIFHVDKSTVSKTLHELSDAGLVDMSNNRSPKLTESGITRAQAFSDKVNINLNHLLYEGVDFENARHDSIIMAFYCSDATNFSRSETDQLYRAKRVLAEYSNVSGDQICALLADGEYGIPFFIYKAKSRTKTDDIISMANNGFEQPVILSVKDHTGTLILHGKTMTAKSRMTERYMTGKVSTVKYYRKQKFVSCESVGDYFSIPMESISFENLKSGNRPVLHGFIRLKLQCSVGPAHMPESEAILTLIL